MLLKNSLNPLLTPSVILYIVHAVQAQQAQTIFLPDVIRVNAVIHISL